MGLIEQASSGSPSTLRMTCRRLGPLLLSSLSIAVSFALIEFGLPENSPQHGQPSSTAGEDRAGTELFSAAALAPAPLPLGGSPLVTSLAGTSAGSEADASKAAHRNT